MGFVTKKELFRIPVFSFWMRQIGCVSLDRSNARDAVRLYAALGRKIKETGAGFIMFPEGTRTRDPLGTIGPFREGSLRLATQEEIPMLPVSIDGTRFLTKTESMYRTRKGGRLVRVKIAPLKVFRVNTAQERKQAAAELRETIVGNFKTIRVTWPAGEAPLPSTARKESSA